MSESIGREETIEFNIFFKDFILVAYLKGLKTLKTLKTFKLNKLFNFYIRLVATIIKSNKFQLSLK